MTATEGNAKAPNSGCLPFTWISFVPCMEQKAPSNSIEDIDQDDEQLTEEDDDSTTVSREDSEDKSTIESDGLTECSQCQQYKRLLQDQRNR